MTKYNHIIAAIFLSSGVLSASAAPAATPALKTNTVDGETMTLQLAPGVVLNTSSTLKKKSTTINDE